MAQGEMSLTVTGNVTDDPELRFLGNGVPVCRFRVATTPRVYDAVTSQWTDGEASFVPVQCWRTMAERVAESIGKGTRVVVTGTWRQRSYTTEAGEKRTVWELEADDIGASMKFAGVKVTKMQRASTGAAPAGGSDGDAWSTD
jgi:single-strand DNA-binding protein